MMTTKQLVKSVLAVLLFGFETCMFAGVDMAVAAEKPEPPKVKVLEGGESHLSAAECRKMVVGPEFNQPDSFPGYTGFVGWESPILLRNGMMYCTFNAGYWHVSPPTPFNYSPSYIKAGVPTDVDAPTGGRAMITKSTDNGVTWEKPRTFLDSSLDDQSPVVTELTDGTLVCSLFTGGPGHMRGSIWNRTGVVRSFDGGKTWEQEIRRIPMGFTYTLHIRYC